MRRKSRSILNLFALTLLCLGFSGCDNLVLHAKSRGGGAKGTTGTIMISLGFAGASSGKISKTILPGFAAAAKAYKVVLSQAGQDDQSKTSGSASATLSFTGLVAGTWTIDVHAYSSATTLDGSTLIGSGSSSATVSEGGSVSVSVPITFTGDGSGQGELSIELVWPKLTGVNYLKWQFNGFEGENVPDSEGDNYTTTLTRVASPASYKLILTFMRGGSDGPVVATIVEAVNIVAGMTSGSWIDGTGAVQSAMSFSTSDFFDSTSDLADLDLGSHLTGFSRSTYTYNFTTNPTSAFTFTATRAMASQTISYEWNYVSYAWASTVGLTSTSQALAPIAGTNTLKIIVTAPDRQTTETYAVTQATLVSSATDLTALGGDSGSNVTDNYILAADIDATAANWNPISAGYHNGYGFNGSFDGNGHTVKYKITSTTRGLGFFGNIVSGGTVKNLNVECDIVSTYAGDGYIGGIAGQNMGTIIHCSTSGKIVASNCNGVGGLVGQNGRGNSDQAGTIIECYSSANVTGGSQIGGLVGALGDSVAGPISSITNSYARGAVKAIGIYVGGLVGSIRQSGKIENSYATGAVTGTTNGGLVGYQYAPGTITSCYYDSTVFTGVTTFGTGYPTATMTDSVNAATNYSGWDFATTWGIGAIDGTTVNGGYPYLKYFGAGTMNP